MRSHANLLVFACLAASLAQPAQAAADWISIAKSDRTEVFANPASLGVSPLSWVIVRTKQNFVEPQADLSGERVQKTKIGEKNLKWMDAPTGTVFGEIVDYACKNVPGAAPGALK